MATACTLQECAGACCSKNQVLGGYAHLKHVKVVFCAQDGDDRVRHRPSGALEAVFVGAALRHWVHIVPPALTSPRVHLNVSLDIIVRKEERDGDWARIYGKERRRNSTAATVTVLLSK